MQHPVYQQPLGFPPRPRNHPIGVLSHQRPAVIDGTFGPVTAARPPIEPVAPADGPEFKVYVGKIGSTVDSDFVLSLLQLCGVVKSWNPVRNPIDGTRTAFGFCDFESAEGSLRAMRLLNKLSIDGQELVLNVNETTKAYLQKFGENTTEANAKEAETETRDGMVSLHDNENDSSGAIPHLTERGAVVGGQMTSQGKTKRCRYGTEEYFDSDEDAMQKIRFMIEDRMKSKFPCFQGREEGEVSPAGNSSLQSDEVLSMDVSIEWESTVEHKRKRQHRESLISDKHNNSAPREEVDLESQATSKSGNEEGEFHMNSDEEKSIVCVPGLISDKHNSSAPREEVDLESQATSKSGNEEGEFHMNSDEEKSIACVPGLISDEHNSSAPREEVDLESQATSKSGNEEGEFHMNSDEEKSIVCLPVLISDKHTSSVPGEEVDLESQARSKLVETLDTKQLLAAVPKTKEELFSYDVNWAIYDKHGLHGKMRPWISEKTAEIFGEEIPEFVDYVVASTKEHVEAHRMLEALASLMDHSAEKFVLSVWTNLIFEIKKAEAGLV